MVYKVFLLSAIFVFSTAVQSHAYWIHVTGNKKYSATYYDPLGASIIDKQYWKVRVLADNVSPSATTFGTSVITEKVYDCRIPRYYELSETWYSDAMGRGNVTKKFPFEDNPRWFRIFVPEDDMIRDLLCNY